MVEPIENRLEKLVVAIEKLIEELFPNKDLKIGYTTLFAKNDGDYDSLRSVLDAYGWEEPANNGFKYHVERPIIIGKTHIMKIRVRKPDVHRPELGCCDLAYKDSDYECFRKRALEMGLDIIVREGYEMIELSNFDIPVYAYIVKGLS